MSKFPFLYRVGWLALLLTALLVPRVTWASHALGADMTYISVAPSIYLVQYRLYRDCSGISAPASIDITYEATGCGPTGNGVNAGGSATLLPRLSQTANPYCRQQNQLSLCDSLVGRPSNGFPNYNIYTYARIVAFGGGLTAICSRWILSAALNARPNTHNLGASTDLYTYALINNRDVTSDSSPAFPFLSNLQPLAVMYENSNIRYNSSVRDDEGDSLVYSLQQPLSAYNVPISYINGYSLQAPIRLQAGTSPIQIDQQGTLAFNAGAMIPGSPDDEANKFAVVIQVEAWRRVNGTPVLVSQVRREIAALIVRNPSGANAAPQVTPGDSSIQVSRTGSTEYIGYGDTIYATANENLGLSIPFMDINSDSIFIMMSGAPVGSVMSLLPLTQGGGVSRRFARIFWTPTAADVRAQGHPFYLQASDNGCPGKANAYYPLTVMVAPLRPTGLAEAKSKKPLIAYPNPFTSDVRLTIKRTTADGTAAVQIYDAMGRLVDQMAVPGGAGTHTLTWHPSSALPAGQYVARYRGTAGQQHAVLVKQ